MTLLLLLLAAFCAFGWLRTWLRADTLEDQLEMCSRVAEWRLTDEYHEMKWHGRPFFVPYPPIEPPPPRFPLELLDGDRR